MSNLLAKWAVKKAKLAKWALLRLRLTTKFDQNPQSCLICLATSCHIIMYDLYQGTNKLKYYYCW